MKFIKYIINLSYHKYVFNKKYRSKFTSIVVVLMLLLFAMLFGFKLRDNEIRDNRKQIVFLSQDKSVLLDSIELLNNMYDTDLKELNDLKNDADYYKYEALKYADIKIPKRVNHDDIKLMAEYREKFNIPKKYYYRLIWKESRYKPKVKSNKGASGYMQIIPKTFSAKRKDYEAKYGSIRHLKIEQQNILVGTYYLDNLYHRYNDWKLAFAAYNAGSGNVRKAGNKVPNINETKKYVKFITVIDN